MDVAPGLREIEDEMARQFRDARTTFAQVLKAAQPVARRIAAAGRVVMLGMGASHWANRMAAPSYRGVGIRAYPEILSEYMRAPLPPGDRVTLITSQSGESGEIASYFAALSDRRDHFGLTLNADSTLGRLVPVLAGSGGPEKPYAATRSIVITLALHAAILHHLGHDDAALMEVLERDASIAPDADAVAELASCRTLFLSGRGQAHSVLEAAALTFMELARMPAIALELGQLLHGPLECLAPGTALVLAREIGPDASGITRMAEAALSYGMRPVLFDLGRQDAVAGAIRVPLPARKGLAAVLELLPSVQRHVIHAAARRVSDFGRPRRSSKITDGEAT